MIGLLSVQTFFTESPSIESGFKIQSSYLSFSPITGIESGFKIQSSYLSFSPYIGLGLGFISFLNLPDDLKGFLFDPNFSPYSELEILFGRGFYQDSDFLKIDKNDLGIINQNSTESILAGIVFNSIKAFASSNELLISLWGIKRIRENNQDYLYGAIVVEIKK